eukprot:11213369-Lingulodinium_polyedra.AAC.1
MGGRPEGRPRRAVPFARGALAPVVAPPYVKGGPLPEARATVYDSFPFVCSWPRRFARPGVPRHPAADGAPQGPVDCRYAAELDLPHRRDGSASSATSWM